MPTADITKRAIADTMKKLMANEPLAKISVGNIVEACGMTRNSFYYHFKDKFDLVNWIFYTEITQALSHEAALDKLAWPLIEDICTFFYNDRTFYQNALTVTGQNSFAEYFDDLLRKLMEIRIGDIYADDEDRDFCVSFFVNAFVSSISSWLIDGAKIPPDRYAQLLQKAMTGVAARIVDLEDGGCKDS